MAETLEDLARECAERIWSIDNSGYLDGSRIGQYSNLILSTLRKAAKQERDRCAKVAQDQVSPCSFGDWIDGHDAARHDIAVAIRSLT